MPPRKCVVQDCSHAADKNAGISIHNSPKSPGKLRNQWIRFVRTKRSNFDPAGRFGICSIHFGNDDFVRLHHIEGSGRRLVRGAVPTIWKPKSKAQSQRAHRTALKEIFVEHEKNTHSSADNLSTGTLSEPSVPKPSEVPVLNELEITTFSSHSNTTPIQEVRVSQPPTPAPQTSADSNETPTTPSSDPITFVLTSPETTIQPLSSSTPLNSYLECNNCATLKSEKKALHSKIRRLEKNLKEKETQMQLNQSRWVETIKTITPETASAATQTAGGQDKPFEETRDENEESEDEDEDIMEIEYGPENDDEDADWTPEQIDLEYHRVKQDDDSSENLNPKLDYKNKDVREEPKGIVFLSKLLLLFQHCHFCFASNPDNNISQTGTLLTVESNCHACKMTNTWKSQPYLLGRFPAGNLLLSFAILTAGASFSKISLVFQHMGLLMYHRSVYYYHQRHLLIPTIVAFWRSYQNNILESLDGKDVVLAGDGRHDSMGHSAKYCTYTIFCCTVGLIIDTVLVQANQAGNSSSMEFLGHQRAIAFLLTTGMVIRSFISDRHTSITKWMREECPKKCKELGKPVIDHFFDLWHIAKKIKKVLTKLGKEKGCEIITKWKKSCVKHFYWSVTSTPAKMGAVIVAKFHAFLSHVINQHTNLPNKLFNKCNHEEYNKPRVWMKKCSDAYEELTEALEKPSLVKGIKNTSPVAQTSCLEGFHSVLNQFAPKMLAYSYSGMHARTLLAALHFNYNLRRESKTDDNGNPKLRLVYPKFKEGQATVREVKVLPNYDYVNELFGTLTSISRQELKSIESELDDDTPEPMHSMLDKQDEKDAILKYKQRKNKETSICPPTCTNEELEQLTTPTNNTTNSTATRKVPCCRNCGQPTKGHPKKKNGVFQCPTLS